MNARVVALVGNPNCGKTTLFNALTNGHQRVGNWPGVTVERKEGFCVYKNNAIRLVDLPGCYGLDDTQEMALDEKITTRYVISQSASLIINVIDATQLERSLCLTLQLLETGTPVIVAINMMDVAEKEGFVLNTLKLAQSLKCSVIPIVALHKEQLVNLTEALFRQTDALAPETMEYRQYVTDSHYREQRDPLALEASEKRAHWEWALRRATALQETAAHLVRSVCHRNAKSATPTWTDQIDRWVLHQWLGIPIFLILIYCVFSFTIQIGGGLQGLWADKLQNSLVRGVAIGLNSLEISEVWVALCSAGIGQGVYTTLSFIPVIMSMFFCLSMLEGSGYMARAAFIMDRVMQFVGLSGKSFVPMILGFGCNVPAILGARTLLEPRERIVTILMTPFMSCGARLAIYALFVTAFFPHQGQNIIFSLYCIGIMVALLTGWALRYRLAQDHSMPLIMELPTYRWPSLKRLLHTTYHRTRRFVLKAGAIIIPLCMVIGSLGFMRTTQEVTWLTTFGRSITPIFAPMGIEEDNWPATVGLVTGLLAKEVVVGTLGALYADEDSVMDEDLQVQDADARMLGRMVQRFGSEAAAFSYLLFVLLYFPCVSVMATISRELDFFWALFAAVWTTGVAYSVAVLFYQAATFSTHALSSTLWITSVLAAMTAGFWSLTRWAQNKMSRKQKAFPTRITVLS